VGAIANLKSSKYLKSKIDADTMPTVLRKDGFKVIIYFDDHLPAHVHVISGDSEVKIDLGSLAHLPQIMQFHGKRSEAVKALALVTTHQIELLVAWRQIHGTP